LTTPSGDAAEVVPAPVQECAAEPVPGRVDIARDLLRRKAMAESGRSIRAAGLTEAQRHARRQTDQANAEVLRRILSDHGWPGRTLVGSDASRAAWLIALRADDVEFQKLALAKLADAVAQSEAEPAQWAHLYDRCCALADVPQLFGTQFRFGAAGIEVYPVLDPETLDERRAQYGLGPHAESAESLRRRHSGAAA
jgi:hypothetical protein